jgi:hypothetical protein
MTNHFASFIGKDFKVVLQAAPFVFFEFMDDQQQEIWKALCQLSPLIFLTRIEDMDSYQHNIQIHIHQFLFLLSAGTAQWVNKPKLHMLLHYPESVNHLGPGSLFATKRFKSYNSVLRNSLVHSNWQSPGRDIAITFANFRDIHHLLSGGFYKEPKLGRYVQAAPDNT